MTEDFFFPKVLWKKYSNEFFYTSKKISPTIQRQAKQELGIKVAQNWFEGTMYQSASYHNFFFVGIKTPMGVERLKEMESLFVGQKNLPDIGLDLSSK